MPADKLTEIRRLGIRGYPSAPAFGRVQQATDRKSRDGPGRFNDEWRVIGAQRSLIR
jgi:hypothetical protein